MMGFCCPRDIITAASSKDICELWNLSSVSTLHRTGLINVPCWYFRFGRREIAREKQVEVLLGGMTVCNFLCSHEQPLTNVLVYWSHTGSTHHIWMVYLFVSVSDALYEDARWFVSITPEKVPITLCLQLFFFFLEQNFTLRRSAYWITGP